MWWARKLRRTSTSSSRDPSGFVTVIGGDGDKPLLLELLVALDDGLDKVTVTRRHAPTACWYCSSRPETVSGVVDPSK